MRLTRVFAAVAVLWAGCSESSRSASPGTAQPGGVEMVQFDLKGFDS